MNKGDRVIYKNDYFEFFEWAEIRSDSVIDGCYDLIIKYKDNEPQLSYNVPEKYIELDSQYYREQRIKKLLNGE